MSHDSSRGSIARTNGRILLFGIALLYASTATYVAALIWCWSSANILNLEAVNGLSSPSYDGQKEIAAFESASHKQSWMITITLAVNVSVAVSYPKSTHLIGQLQLLTGDAIVWWRACVIWQRKVVKWVCPLLLASTMSMSRSFVFMSSLSSHLIPLTFVVPLEWSSRVE